MSLALPVVAAPRRTPPSGGGRHLEVVREGRVTRRVSGMAVACASVGGLLVLLFVLAVLQTAIAQGQAHLDQVATQSVDLQAEAQARRLEVAQMESPERIISEAEARLGMVEPQVITYLQPADVDQPPAPVPVAPVYAAAAPEVEAGTEIPPADPSVAEVIDPSSSGDADVPTEVP